MAVHLGVGFVEVRKGRTPACDSDQWVRHLELGVRRDLVQAHDRVLVVDDRISTGSRARTVKAMVGEVGAAWIGLACIVDALTDARLRRDLRLHSLVHVREL